MGSVSGTINLLLGLTATRPLDLSTPTDALRGSDGAWRWTVESGTGLDQADVLWHDERTVADSATDDLDLAGTLTDAFGQTVAMARLKAMMIWRVLDDDASAATLAVGGAAANELTSWVGAAGDKVLVRAGGVLLLAAPDAVAYAVTGGSADTLRLTHGGEDSENLTYRIALLGATA